MTRNASAGDRGPPATGGLTSRPVVIPPGLGDHVTGVVAVGVDATPDEDGQAVRVDASGREAAFVDAFARPADVRRVRRAARIVPSALRPEARRPNGRRTPRTTGGTTGGRLFEADVAEIDVVAACVDAFPSQQTSDRDCRLLERADGLGRQAPI